MCIVVCTYIRNPSSLDLFRKYFYFFRWATQIQSLWTDGGSGRQDNKIIVVASFDGFYETCVRLPLIFFSFSSSITQTMCDLSRVQVFHDTCLLKRKSRRSWGWKIFLWNRNGCLFQSWQSCKWYLLFLTSISVQLLTMCVGDGK